MSGWSSTKPLAIRTMDSNSKYVVETFDGINKYFGMWQCKVMDALIQQKIDITLEEKHIEMSKNN